MNAIEFVKKFGWKEAQICLLNCAMPQDKWFMRRGDLISGQDFDDLKQIVEAWELVEKAGGVDESKLILASIKPWHTGYNIVSKTYFGGDIFSQDQEFYIEDLLEAINLVEQCQK